MKSLPIKSALAFALGIVSATLCWFGARFLTDYGWLVEMYPGAVFGLCLFALGEWIIKSGQSNRLSTVIALTLSSILAWRLAVTVGHAGPLPYVSSGLLGGGIIAIAITLLWKLYPGSLKVVVPVTLAGALGGAIFHPIDAVISDSREIWIWLLFAVWQSTLMLAIAIAVHGHGNHGKPAA